MRFESAQKKPENFPSVLLEPHSSNAQVGAACFASSIGALRCLSVNNASPRLLFIRKGGATTQEPEMNKVVLLGGVLLLMAGCATVDKIALDSTKRVPTKSVEFLQGTYPTNNYKIIATLMYLGPQEDEMKAIRHFTTQGKQLGGNAVVMEWPPKGEKKLNISPFGAGYSSAYTYRAAVVVWTEKQETTINFN